MAHHTKDKGDIASAIVIADLTKKGYSVFIPLSEHLPFDLIAYKEKQTYRIQVKYSSDGFIKNSSSWADKTGNHRHLYKQEDFDFYAVYLPEKETVVYPSIEFGGKTISTSFPGSASSFYWWEDFRAFTTSAKKRTLSEFGLVANTTANLKNTPARFKIEWPSKEELERLVSEMPTSKLASQLGVSDSAIGKRCKQLGIKKPERGFWAKQAFLNIKNE